MKTYKYKCNQCKDATSKGCKLKVTQSGGPPADPPCVCPWTYDLNTDKSNWIRYDNHNRPPEYYISCNGTLISSGYTNRSHAEEFIKEWSLLNCTVVEL